MHPQAGRGTEIGLFHPPIAKVYSCTSPMQWNYIIMELVKMELASSAKSTKITSNNLDQTIKQ